MLVFRVAMLILGIVVCVYLVNQYLPSDQMLGKGELVIWPHGALAALLFILHVLAVYFAWHYSLGMVGMEVSPKLSLGIFLGSLVTRYLPGGIWHLGSRLLALSRRGKNVYLVGVTLVLEQLAALAVCLFLVLLFVALWGLFFPQMSGMLAGNVMTGGGLPLIAVMLLSACLYPPVFRKLLAWAFSLLNKQELKVFLPSASLYRLYGIHAFSLLVFALGYQQILALVSVHTMPPTAVVMGVVLIATLLGYLAPFVPGGIGIRESLMVVLMTPFMNAGDATAMAVLGRVFIIGVEFFLLSLAILGYRSKVES